MRRGNIGKEELWKQNIRRLERLDDDTKMEVKMQANILVRNTSLSKDAALKMELDAIERGKYGKSSRI